eukprot:11039970-Ditylum_brightwellii.AAC.1
MPEKLSAACRSHSQREGKHKANAKQMKRVTATGDKLLSNVMQIAVDVSIVSTMGLAGIALMSVTSPFPTARAICTMNARKDPARVSRSIFAATKPSCMGSHLRRART